MRLIKRAAAITLILLLTIFFVAYWIVARQGISESYWSSFNEADVVFDENGIPTISAKDWESVFETQGFVTASDRLWQMDLARRKGSGRLAEWFGNIALEYDVKTRSEDRDVIVAKAYTEMRKEEKRTCDAYARGINKFISEFDGKWGLEYTILRQTPQKWHCTDSLLVLLVMSAELTSTSKREASTTDWHDHLSKEWFDFLFPKSHPWNEPYFGTQKEKGPTLPPVSQHLPRSPLSTDQKSVVTSPENFLKGSNGWTWRGATTHFLANDPHLGINIPGIWYAMRLRISENDWIVGASIPGLPGIIIGMNPYIAWGFTNVGEDVDDLLLEKLNEDETKYVAATYNGKEVWRDIKKKNFEIRTKDKSVEIEAWFTHRGPLSKRKGLGDNYYSRQWLPLKEGMLHLPTSNIGLTRNWKEFNAAIDNMRVPAQNAIYMDYQGNIGYRMSGTGIVRKSDGIMIQNALEGEWQAFESYSARPRLYWLNDKSDAPVFFASANQRKRIGKFGHHYGSDDRAERIRALLSSSKNLSREDMERFQLDTSSRFRKLLLSWIVSNTNLEKPALFKSWKKWTGESTDNQNHFIQGYEATKLLQQLLLSRLKRAFFPKDSPDAIYRNYNNRGWLLQVLLKEEGLAPFGLDKVETANYLLEKIAQVTADDHAAANRWKGQHPFVGRVPLFGDLFKVKEILQYGDRDVLRAERPYFGPSMRLVWELSNPIESTWVFPTGQSGHIRSKYYKSFQKLWVDDKRTPVFATKHSWKFARDIQNKK